MANQTVKLKRFDYTDILGWSVSRYDKFTACKRQYYYDYYPKHDLEFPLQKIMSLKKMTSVPLETGNVVHDAIKILLERLLENEKPIDNKRFLEFARKKTEDYVNSKQFAEVYYKEIEKADAADVSSRVERALTNFLNSGRYSWIVKSAITNKSGWVIEPPGFGETRINGFKAYCKVDFLFPADGKTYILDWKTGKANESKHKKQMTGYSSWASYHFNVVPADIVPIIAYLAPQYSELQAEVSAADTAAFVGTVESETKEMYDFCRDIQKNLPKEKAVFKMTDNLRICAFCNYRELCGRQDVKNKKAEDFEF